MLRFLASERGINNLGITWKDIVTDYGATSGGSGTASGDFTAFKDFRDWAVGQSGWVGLTLPPSSGSQYYGVVGTYQAADGSGFPPAITDTPFFGIPKLVVWGYGAAINRVHGSAIRNNGADRADIHSVSAGSRSVTLVTPGDAALFSVGAMVLLAGLDLQGFGYPPNSHFNEWHRIADITGDVITFEQPIAYDYSEDWPRYTEGDEFEIGGIGAAAIVRTIPAWDCEQKIFGLRSTQTGQTYSYKRKVMLIDCVNEANGFIIGASEDHRIINQKHSTSGMEVDKLTTRGLIGEYGPADLQIIVQSSSVDRLEVRGGTRIINGTAKNMLIHRGSSSSIALGPTSYGISESITIRDYSFAAITSGAMYDDLDAGLTYEGSGVFRYVGGSPPQFLVPGAVAFLRTVTPFFDHSPFRVLSVTGDAGDTLITTTLEGASLPEVTGYANASVVRHNAPNLTVENCVGSAEALELSQAGSNKPYGTFRQRSYDGLSAGDNLGFLMGRLVHIKVNVITPYTGIAGTLQLTIGGQFGTWTIATDGTPTRFQTCRVNLKVAGERVITPSGVTGSQSGDTNLSSLAADIWLPNNGNFGNYIGNGTSAVDISGESVSVYPSVTVEVLTDQEIPQG